MHIFNTTLHLTQPNVEAAVHQAIVLAGVIFMWLSIVVPELDKSHASQPVMILFTSYSVIVLLDACFAMRKR